MTYREQAIKDLEDIIATAEGIKGLSDDAGITISLDKIESLKFALESIKVDRAYDLAYEKVDFIEIPEGATFGNMIMAILSDMPNVRINENFGRIWVMENGEDIANFRQTLWNSPYRKEN